MTVPEMWPAQREAVEFALAHPRGVRGGARCRCAGLGAATAAGGGAGRRPPPCN